MKESQREIEIKGSPSRCPYCHDEVSASTDDASVCVGCLARHHKACWTSHGSCAACSSPDRLEPAARAAVTPQTAARQTLLRSGMSREVVEAIETLASGPRASASGSRASGVGVVFAKIAIVLAFSVGVFFETGAHEGVESGLAAGLIVAGLLGTFLVATRAKR